MWKMLKLLLVEFLDAIIFVSVIGFVILIVTYCTRSANATMVDLQVLYSPMPNDTIPTDFDVGIREPGFSNTNFVVSCHVSVPCIVELRSSEVYRFYRDKFPPRSLYVLP